MYSSGETRCVIMYVSKMMKSEKITAPPIPMAKSTISD